MERKGGRGRAFRSGFAFAGAGKALGSSSGFWLGCIYERMYLQDRLLGLAQAAYTCRLDGFCYDYYDTIGGNLCVRRARRIDMSHILTELFIGCSTFQLLRHKSLLSKICLKVKGPNNTSHLNSQR